MRVLITGGAGYIGYSLIERFAMDLHIDEIIIYDNLVASGFNFLIGKKVANVKFVCGDILNTDYLTEVLKGVDVVVHLAGHVTDPYNYHQSQMYDQINQWGTLSVVRSVENSNVKKFVFLSSVSIYGFKNDIELPKEPAPSNAYGRSKLAAEKYVQLLSRKMEVEVIRSANVYGYNPCFRVDSVINKFTLDALLHNRVKIFGTGNQMRSFVYVENLVDAIYNSVLGGMPEKNTVTIDFCASIHQILGVFKYLVPNLELLFVNRHVELESQSFVGYGGIEGFQSDLERAFMEFKAGLRIQFDN